MLQESLTARDATPAHSRTGTCPPNAAGFLFMAKPRTSRDAPYVPTPAEIEQAAAAIRAGWSDEMFYQRAGKPLPVTVQEYHEPASGIGIGILEAESWLA